MQILDELALYLVRIDFFLLLFLQTVIPSVLPMTKVYHTGFENFQIITRNQRRTEYILCPNL